MRIIRAAAAALPLVLLGLDSSTAAAALPDFGTEPVQDTSSSGGSNIVDVRVGANDGFDRFVVEFEGEVGAYFVSYVDQVTQDGSGAVVPVEGAAFVQVSVNGVPNDPVAPQETIDAGLIGLIEVVGAGAGFEATVSYGLGTTQASGFRVFTLTEPSRLVVDIAHPDVTPTASNTDDPTASETIPDTSTEASPTEPSPQVTPAEATGDSGSSRPWLLFLIVGLVVFAIVTGILGWRMRRPSSPPR